ncbi:hypothetical protein J8L13_15245 [Bacteroides fragilis]|uniref:hypothetical protein n=1 Tax=Bacteroides fragilis TaxID=817 RepID=UPI00202DFB76|nr:hypothetical protein [Bacteroides fragilis]MCM0238744.1 hypothetical protein [Bacteroides fragilis]
MEKTVNLNLPKGVYVNVYISAKGGYSSKVVITDDEEEKIKVHKDDNKAPFMVLEIDDKNNYFKSQSSNLQMTVSFLNHGKEPNPNIIKMASTENTLVSEVDGSVIGYARNYCFEDHTDDDYSDLMISIIACKKY